jgi:hypothetical protein
MPWISILDNCYTSLSGFSEKDERNVFELFVAASLIALVPQELRMPANAWKSIKTGLYSHGWTLSRRECKYADGRMQFTLWGGTPTADVFQSKQRFSEVQKQLRLTWRNERLVDWKISSAKCPLNDATGIHKG